ncbi:hypothetical protein AB6A40_000089 [Gnathostoma spinigerum]|uniref:Uncharacterized protein n=1 Tax=Gnathostoma spinigerum TaxID=75299 RepID=A0ABD6EAQ5_9BILA
MAAEELCSNINTAEQKLESDELVQQPGFYSDLANHSVSITSMTKEENRTTDHMESVEEFRDLMYKMQSVRRKIVSAILEKKDFDAEWSHELQKTFSQLTNSHTKAFQREMSTLSNKLSINIKDETLGLKKDLEYIAQLNKVKEEYSLDSWLMCLKKIDLASILAPFHPISETKFYEECDETIKFLSRFIVTTNGKKPILITDWDGTMKDYCSQYATNLQPIYSAVGMTRFAARFTRLSAVLTAGPLRGPGILDLTAIPIDGPLLFSGSWGREWWINGRRLIHDDGISDEGHNALHRFNDEMQSLLHSNDFSQFALVGSGVQRKVDRLTLGVQNVCHHVSEDLSTRYKDAVKERMYRVDPDKRNLVFDPSTDLDVEIVAHNSGSVWNKADGVDHIVKTVGDSLETPGHVLICGDTNSDLPMVRQAASRNPEAFMAIFVGMNENLKSSVRTIITDPTRCCFVSCPDVIHAAMAAVLNQTEENE